MPLKVFTEELSPYWEENKAVAAKVGAVLHAVNGTFLIGCSAITYVICMYVRRGD